MGGRTYSKKTARCSMLWSKLSEFEMCRPFKRYSCLVIQHEYLRAPSSRLSLNSGRAKLSMATAFQDAENTNFKDKDRKDPLFS
jgi:hypothetical protein